MLTRVNICFIFILDTDTAENNSTATWFII